MPEHKNVWDTGREFNDNVSHFNRFTKTSIQKFFGTRGQWSEMAGSPNWVQPVVDDTGLEYQLVRLDDEGNLEKEFPVQIRLRARSNLDLLAPPDEGKGKGVASWDYRLQTEGLEFWSDDPVKHIICNSDGLVYAIGSRIPAGGHNKFLAYNQLNVGVAGGKLAITPFAVLAFFMWLESDEPTNLSVNNYLVRIGWSTDGAV